nr:RNA-directed DNA polymerase, eukaryota [Tanacetum cinerariifolium]
MRLKLGNGDTTAFCEDNWIGGNVLKDLYPRIYALQTCKSVTVSKKLTDYSLDNSFRRKTRGGVEQVQYNALSDLVHAVTLVPLSDRWVWSLESSEEFSVASVRKVIDEKRLSNVNTMTRWIKCVPIKTWNYISLNDSNAMVRFKKKLQALKKVIRLWIGNYKRNQMNRTTEIKSKLKDIDKLLDQLGANNDLLSVRSELLKQYHDIQSVDTRESIQKAKIKWAIEGDEDYKFFHGMINRKRANLAVKGVMIEGEWVDDPSKVKDEFRDYFAYRFCDPGIRHGVINFNFPNRLNIDQSGELEAPISRDEIRRAVWDCGENKSPGPDGFTFEFFRRFWNIIRPDLCLAVEWFFHHASFPVGCNSSFIALIPKTLNPKSV